MSFIRSWSNTESIYIFESGSGIELMKGVEEHFVIPPSIFINLIRKYILNQSKEIYKFNKSCLFLDDDCMWHIKYKDVDFTFSNVILHYIINNQPWVFCNKLQYFEFMNINMFKQNTLSQWRK